MIISNINLYAYNLLWKKDEFGFPVWKTKQDLRFVPESFMGYKKVKAKKTWDFKIFLFLLFSQKLI